MTSLNLEMNHIRAEGAAAIAEALQGNGVLISLNLSDNALCGVKFGRERFLKTNKKSRLSQ